MNTEAEAEDILRRIADQPDEAIDIAEGALALAAYDRPRVGLDRYRRHLEVLAEDVATEAARRGTSLEARVGALNHVLLEQNGYSGDRLTYDDLQNANLMRVIDRRRGLPVALGILFIGTAAQQGWPMCGINFPGHFLVRLDLAGESAIIDPFNQGERRDAAQLRSLLKSSLGERAELAPGHYAPVSRRDVLLRLQNNIKIRLIGLKRFADALRVVERIELFAPGIPEFLREGGMLNAKLGNVRAAIDLLERYLGAGANLRARHEVMAVLQDLKRQLN